MRYEKGTFVTVPNIQSLEILPPTAQALFMWLCSYADEQGQCFPSRSVLAKNLHCSVRSIDAHLNTLIKEGFVQKENRFRDGEQTSNLYQIMLIEVEQKLQEGGAKSARGVVQNLHGGGAKSAHRTKPIEPNTDELKSPSFSDEDMRMTELLISLIVRNNPDWKLRGTKETWAKEIERLHRIDGRTYEQIEYMIRWTQADSFWSQNILSTSKLREKFNDLIPKLKASVVKKHSEHVQALKPKMI